MIRAFGWSVFIHIFGILLFVAPFFLKSSVKLNPDTGRVINFVKVGPVSKAPILGPVARNVHQKDETKKELSKKEEPKKEEKKEEKKTEDLPKDKKEDAFETHVAKQTHKDATETVKMNYKKSKHGAKKEVVSDSKQSGPSMQRAEEIGDELTASDNQYIRDRLTGLWDKPAFAETTDIKITVSFKFNRLGVLLDYKIIKIEGSEYIDPVQEEAARSSIESTCMKQGFNLQGLDEKMLRKIEKDGLDVIFDSSEDFE